MTSSWFFEWRRRRPEGGDMLGQSLTLPNGRAQKKGGHKFGFHPQAIE
jgi:hypothetical protein